MLNSRAILTIFAIGLVSTACERLLTTQATVVVLPQTTPCGNNGRFNSTDTCLQIGTNASGPFFQNKIPGFTHETGFRYKLRVQSSEWNKEIIDEFSNIELLEVLEKTPVSN